MLKAKLQYSYLKGYNSLLMSQNRNMPLVLQAKLYQLQNQADQDVWIEKGMGVPSFGKQENLYKLKFFSQDQNNSCRYQTIVNNNILFERSEPKIITWTLVKDNTEMALSFREEAGANNFWNHIDEYLRKDAVHVQVNSREMFVLEYRIPDPSAETLRSILEELENIPLNEKRERICSIFLTKRDLLPKLRMLFNELERDRASNIENLVIMFQLIKMVLNFSDMELLSDLLSDEYFSFTFGCLEYDPPFINCPHKHREFLSSKARFVEVVPIKSKDRLKQIHFTYRLEYIKDCVLAHLLDDGGLRLHTIIVLSNYKDTLINFVFNPKERDFLNEIFNLLRLQDVRAFRFLSEICRIAKLVDLLYVGNQEIERDVVFSNLADKEIYQILIANIKHLDAVESGEPLQSTPRSRLKTVNDLMEIVEISLQYINSSLEVCANHFKNYCISEKQVVLKYPLISFLLKCVSSKTKFKHQFTKLVSILVDNTENHQITPIAQRAFIDHFLQLDYNFSLMTSILNKLTDNISIAVTEKLQPLLQKLLEVLSKHTTGQKCTKVTILQIIRKILSIYLTEQDLKASIIEVLTRNIDVIVDQMLLSRAHSSLHLSSLLAILKILKRTQNSDFLMMLCQKLSAKSPEVCFYAPKLVNYVKHVIEWKQIPIPQLKRDRPSQMALGQEDFQSLPDKKIKPN